MTDLYAEHLDELARRWQRALHASGVDAALIAAGQARSYFLDDQGPTFRANPHFAQWLPGDDCQNAMLLIRPGEIPRLYFHQERDYWHQPARVSEFAGRFDVHVHQDIDGLTRQVYADVERINRVAFIGELDPADDNLPIAEKNPNRLLSQLHFGRARKTGFELACMRRATEIGVRGHIAAREAFYGGASEFEIHQTYLLASQQNESDLPYGNIVALNEHAGVLHYQHQERVSPDEVLSFLIDAGGRYRGYASDITRTYAKRADTLFADLVARLDQAQQALIQGLAAGQDYVAVHAAMHRAVATILVETGLLFGSAEAALAAGLTETFFPHGLGHLLGVQVHDVGGQLVSADGGLRPPPVNYPALRLTRTIEVGQVFTIEPGIYFIPMLLESLRAGPSAALVNWSAVDELTPYGGIRIEDDVHIGERGIENLTRDAFDAAGS
jgi:Xaa-Pro dipeptidase